MIARLTTYPYELFRTSLTPEQGPLSFLTYSLGLFFPLSWGLLFTGVVFFFFFFLLDRVLDHANFAQSYVHISSTILPIPLPAFVAADLGYLIPIPLFSSPFSFSSNSTREFRQTKLIFLFPENFLFFVAWTLQ